MYIVHSRIMTIIKTSTMYITSKNIGEKIIFLLFKNKA